MTAPKKRPLRQLSDDQLARWIKQAHREQRLRRDEAALVEQERQRHQRRDKISLRNLMVAGARAPRMGAAVTARTR
jgi:hypothetical protein